MRCRTLAPLLLALALAGCTKQEPRPPAACLDTRDAGFARALQRAPGPVRLPDGTSISECLRRVRDDADLQNLGLVLHRVAEGLATRARTDPAAAAQLGYLVGAARRGSERSNGISSELARRLEQAAVALGGRPATARAVRRGLVAGRASG